MALAGVFGDLIGIREVFIASGAIVVVGGLLAAALYRGAGEVTTHAPAPTPVRESKRPDVRSGLEEGVG